MLIWPSGSSQWIKPESAGQQASRGSGDNRGRRPITVEDEPPGERVIRHEARDRRA